MSEEQSKSGALFLLDGMSLAFRAFFALPATLTTEAGVVTNALHGFTSMVANLVRDHHPGALVVAYDLPGGTFRDDLVDDYKGGRDETPEDLPPQFDMIRTVVDALGIPVASAEGFEADDVLATLATEARDRGQDVVVVTGDRDSFQLVEDPHIRVLYNRRGVTDYDLYDEKGIFDRTGVLPRLYPLLAALRGDPSDNLPGVPGVGEKTAAKLLNSYGDLDGIFSHLDELTPKLRENLTEHEDRARSNAVVIPLVRDVPLEISVDDLTLGGWDRGHAESVFGRYELRNLWRRIAGMLDAGAFGDSGSAGGRLSSTGDAVGKEDQSTLAHEAEVIELVLCSATRKAALASISSFEEREGHSKASKAKKPKASTKTGPEEKIQSTLSTISLAGRWAATRGRSPLRGIALIGADRESPGLWIAKEILSTPDVKEAVVRLLSESSLVGHHIKDVFRSLLPEGIDCTSLFMDTAIAAYLLDSSTGDYALDHLADAAGLAPISVLGMTPTTTEKPTGQLDLADPETTSQKEEGRTPESDRDDGAVALIEAATALHLSDFFEEQLVTAGLSMLHDEVEVPLVRVLAKMEVAGIRVDAEELRRIADQLAADASRLEVKIHELAGHEFKVNSTPQLRTVLYEELGLTPGRKTKTGFSTDAATLETLRDVHPIIDTLLSYREVEKLRSTYGENLLREVADDGRIHATFRQTVARTGRLSSERPNLHNIPTRSETGNQFRQAFIPSAGWRFLVADYDQIELRVIAHLSGDPGLLEAFATGGDIHSTVAAGVFGVDPDDVTHAQRDRAKIVSYGLAYGMEAFGLARRLGTSVEEANDTIDRYFSAFPSVRAYMDNTVAEARKRGATRTALGRIRPMPDLQSPHRQARMAAERAAMNAGIQGLAADLFKTALVRLDAALEDGDLQGRLVLQVHDEVVLECPPEEQSEVQELTKVILETSSELSVPLVVSLGWGDTWANAKGG